jgi:catechol 2,3-dioxygenase-like lactoylglutathione lyase family enzyme
MSFKVEQLDHVHVYVSDRAKAAEWYERVLGLTVVEKTKVWAEDPDGPLSISSDGGNTELALFQRPTDVPPAKRQTIAFRVDAAGFRAFLSRLDEHPVFDLEGRQVTAQDISDHQLSFSLYFCDPDGNSYEITTYDYAEIATGQLNTQLITR